MSKYGYSAQEVGGQYGSGVIVTAEVLVAEALALDEGVLDTEEETVDAGLPEMEDVTLDAGVPDTDEVMLDAGLPDMDEVSVDAGVADSEGVMVTAGVLVTAERLALGETEEDEDPDAEPLEDDVMDAVCVVVGELDGVTVLAGVDDDDPDWEGVCEGVCEGDPVDETVVELDPDSDGVDETVGETVNADVLEKVDADVCEGLRFGVFEQDINTGGALLL